MENLIKLDENEVIVETAGALGLIGGGPLPSGGLREVAPLVQGWVAADGGADHLLRAGIEPLSVIGDLDSISDAARNKFRENLHQIKEQQTTDFDKALRSVRAPLIIGLGFGGGLIHHTLAALTVLAQRSAARCILMDEQSVMANCPPGLTLSLAPGDDISLFPMQSLTAASDGLVWPLDGLTLAPIGQIATSNQALRAQVSLRPNRAGLLVILPRSRLSALAAALYSGFNNSAH